MKGIDELITVGWILFGILLSPLLFIAFDFWAGIRKAKQRKEPITSDKWKRTVDKIARYYNALLAVLVVDCLQMAGLWYLDTYRDYHFPIFPAITLIGAIAIGAIEIKSIYEKAEEKEKKEYRDIAALIVEITKHNKDVPSMVNDLTNYLKLKEDGKADI